MTILEIMDRIQDKQRICTLDFPDERKARIAILRLKKKGIVFIAVHKGKGTYERIEVADKKKVDQYVKTELKRWNTHYFDNLIPLKGKTKDIKFEEMMGRLEGVITNDK